jgi:hypothetical protein
MEFLFWHEFETKSNPVTLGAPGGEETLNVPRNPEQPVRDAGAATRDTRDRGRPFRNAEVDS